MKPLIPSRKSINSKKRPQRRRALKLSKANLSWCEVWRKIGKYSGKKCGAVIHSFEAERNSIRVLIADDGIGICESLRRNSEYKDVAEREALRICNL